MRCCGDTIPKVYKTKNNKLAVYIPFDVIEALGIKDGDDLDFLKYGDSTYLVAMKKDIVKLLSKPNAEQPKQQEGKKVYTPRTVSDKSITIEPAELAVLKKLDTLRYSDRTGPKISAILDSSEKAVMQTLIKKNILMPFKRPGEKETKYSIQKNVYDMFLYRNKKPAEQPAQVQGQKTKPAVQKPQTPKAWEQKIAATGSEAYMESLENKGFLVLGNEAEASLVSAALEDSIRQGLVVGTRAFNKKFYIGLRGFINKYAAKILKIIDQKSMNVQDIASETGVDEDGVRTILYFLSESGDVTEIKRDIFRAA